MSFIAYNENGDLQKYESTEGIVKCKYCEKAYFQETEEQVPGFRDRSYDICPYCGKENGSSMEEDYYNSKLEK